MTVSPFNLTAKSVAGRVLGEHKGVFSFPGQQLRKAQLSTMVLTSLRNSGDSTIAVLQL